MRRMIDSGPLQLALVLRSILVLAVTSTVAAQEGPRPSPRNVLFIMADDHAAEVYGAYGNDIVRTPHLDELASEGVRFARAYANSPVCTPSRQSIITGKLPHAAGVTLLRTPLADSLVTIAEHLKGRGFETGAVGKMHFNSTLRHGFDYRVTRGDYHDYLTSNPPRTPPDTVAVRPPWRPFRDPARIWLNAEGRPAPRYDEDSEGSFMARRAIDFLRKNENERFCLWLSFHEPHSPFNFPVEYAGRYAPENMPLPPVSPEDARWVPEEFEHLTAEEKRGIIASYYTSVEYLDKNVGRVLEALEQLELAQNTLVVYVGDHGYLLGHHDRFEKHMMWEPAVRAPLVIRSPGIEPDVNRALVEFVDLVPTILDVLGVPSMEGLQGRSLRPLLEGRTDDHRDYVFSEFLADNKAMVRTDRWKYIFTTGKHDLAQGYATGRGPFGITHRLYDLENDPEEHENLADDPEYSGVVKSLQIKMLERFLKTHPHAEKLPEQLSLEEALVWFCEPPEEGDWQSQ